MKFEDWFYQDHTNKYNPVNDFDRDTSAFFSEMENFLRKAYEAGYQEGLKHRE